MAPDLRTVWTGTMLLSAVALQACQTRITQPLRKPSADPTPDIDSRSLSQFSSLWGKNGELWSPAGQLTDFSFAGYEAGEAKLPDIAPAANVRDPVFGAVGDGRHEDGPAIQAAIDSISQGAVVIPRGTYLVSQVLRISKPGVVLRGEGSGLSVLKFTRPLAELVAEPNQTRWSYEGGLIWVEGEQEARPTLPILQAANRGDRVLKTSGTPSAVVAGDWVQLSLDDPSTGTGAGTLVKRLYAGMAESEKTVGSPAVRFVSKVDAVSGDSISLTQPLVHDVRLAWTPRISAYRPSVHSVGIESLTLKFPDSPTPAHHKEFGFNGIYFSRITNSWIRNVEIVNADNGIVLEHTHFCTVKSITLGSTRGRGPGVQGHHGISVKGNSGSNWVTRFKFNGLFRHDLTVSSWAYGNVFSHGSGPDLSLDHHRRGPNNNLFSQIDLGKGQRAFASGGDPKTGGPHSAVFSTFWNLKARALIDFPDQDFGPKLSFMGGMFRRGAEKVRADWHQESPGTFLKPADLREAQCERRPSCEQR